MQFFMPMIPPKTTHQQKKVSTTGKKPRFYEDEKLKTARKQLRDALIPHRPDEKFEGPLRCMVKWCFPMIKKSVDGQWKVTRPDTHNLNKLLFDVMTDLEYWHDDAQVCSEIIEKFWSATPGIFIQIERLE